MTTITATYSPDDNKLRLYATSRLDADTFARVKAAGFKWAPKQELFVAPAWSPNREDLALDLAGEIGDEDSSLVDRAEVRAERFEDYSEKRMADAESARKAVSAIADNIPFGQPILVGHHSERHAHRDAEKIDSGMRKAVKMWRTSQYWESRAAGALAHAKYKELPEVRARRIKTIEADKRKIERSKANAEKQIKAWQIVAGINDAEKQRAVGLAVANVAGYWSMSFSLADYPRDPPASQYEGPMGLWSAIDGAVITAAQAAAIAIPAYERSLPRMVRWVEHYDFRLTYERAMLDEAGASHLLAPKPRRELPPLLNYRAPGGSITAPNMYDRNRDVTYAQVEMTRADYAKINSDYKGARWSKDKSHRFRTAMKNGGLVAVFLTDSKAHEIPTPGAPADRAAEVADRLAELDAADAAKAAGLDAAPAPPADCIDVMPSALDLAQEIATPSPTADLPSPSPTADFEAMAQSLRAGGVQVVTAPQLFPTPMDLARTMVDVAEIAPGMAMLEPNAGTGRIVRAIREKLGTRDGVSVDGLVAVEIKPSLAETVLRGGLRVPTHCADFLECTPGGLGLFDCILMNPPFEKGDDIRHIEHARGFLKPGGRLVAICADGPRQRARLQPLATEWRALPAGTFKESGTMVNTALLVIDG